jgi:hypothetical protein
MRPYLITAKLMRPSNMKRFPTPGLEQTIDALETYRKHERRELRSGYWEFVK